MVLKHSDFIGTNATMRYSVFIGTNAVMSGVFFGQANAFLKTYVTVLNLADKLSPFTVMGHFWFVIIQVKMLLVYMLMLVVIFL